MTNPTPHGQVPEALRLADELDAVPETGADPQTIQEAAAELRRQHTRIAELQARIKTMAEEHADELMVAHLDGRMRAAQPAGAQQPGAAYAELPQSVGDHKYGGGLYTDAQMRVFADATCAMRASHGQAPAQQESFDHGPQAETVAEAARDVGKWLNERPNRPLDLRHVAMLAHHATAPQQEAQEPVAWYVTGCDRLLDEDEAKAEARHIGGTARAIPLYTAPQPSPTAQGDALSDDAVRVPLDSLHADAAYLLGRLREGSMSYARVIEIIRERIDAAKAAIRARAAQGDALDAARYRYLRDGDWRECDKLESIIRLQLNSLWGAAIDAARKQGANHDPIV